ncbi:MAG: alpha/beta fold hydrolase [Planctomycetes bacterium]|nr:alpha/beta fold hydrolase [Planctomycetota bacterium]
MNDSTPFGELRNAQGERLDYACAGGAGPDVAGLLVVICHGVTANKDRAWARTLAAELADAGLPSLRFSFSGNGASEGDFRASTVTKEVADLGAVLDAVAGRPLCVVGHSMGGAVGVLRAASDPRIGLLVSLAGMVHTAAFAERKFGALTPGRDLMWDKPECPLSAEFMDDMRRVDTVLPRAAEVTIPWLLVHGTEDTVVPCSESREAAAAAPRAELVEVPGADHLFSGDHERFMAQTVVGWLRAQA